jgi:C_GCAxxG_C_C family probable redox protein
MKKEKAIKIFNSGINCAQSVASVYTEKFNIDEEILLTLASGFGAGMGKLQKTCGAVTGAFMVIGMANRNIPVEKRKDKIYSEIFNFEQKFQEKMKSSSCDQLLNCDLKTGEGREKFKSLSLKKNVCEKCIITAIELLDEMIEL